MLFPFLVCPSLLELLPILIPAVSVGRPKHTRVMAGALEGDTFIGRRAQEYRGLLKIKYPMEHGIVTDWDDMERIWNWIYAEELGTLSEEVRSHRATCAPPHPHIFQHPVLLTEAPLNPRSNRDVAAQILFDTFNVPALFTSVQAVLSLFVFKVSLCPKLTATYDIGMHQDGQPALFSIRATVLRTPYQFLKDSQCHTQFGALMSQEGKLIQSPRLSYPYGR